MILKEGDKVKLIVDVLDEFNMVLVEKTMIDISPSDLEECDLPEDGEVVGKCNLSEGIMREFFDSNQLPRTRGNFLLWVREEYLNLPENFEKGIRDFDRSLYSLCGEF